MLTIGTTDAKGVYIGGIPAKAVYQGDVQVWPVGSSWLPTELSGLTVWLDANDTGDLSTAWKDLSGLGHHGTIVGSPAPTKTSTLNGMSVVRFRPDQGRVRGTTGHKDANPTLGGYNFTVVYLARMVGPNVGRVFTAVYPPENFLIGFHIYGYDWMYDNGFVNDYTSWGAGGSTPWIMYAGTASHDGVTFNESFYKNGTYLGGVTSGMGMGNTYNLSGYDVTGGQETCDAEVAELIIYNRRLSDEERGQVESYLQEKWGL